MLLGVIPMFFFFFEILSDFGENRKRGKLEKSGQFGFLRRSVGCLRRGEAGVPKWHPRVHYCVA